MYSKKIKTHFKLILSIIIALSDTIVFQIQKPLLKKP